MAVALRGGMPTSQHADSKRKWPFIAILIASQISILGAAVLVTQRAFGRRPASLTAEVGTDGEPTNVSAAPSAPSAVERRNAHVAPRPHMPKAPDLRAAVNEAS